MKWRLHFRAADFHHSCRAGRRDSDAADGVLRCRASVAARSFVSRVKEQIVTMRHDT
jgi:hypothetical protein